MDIGESSSNPIRVGRMMGPEDDNESRSGSDNIVDVLSGDDQEVAAAASAAAAAAGEQPPKRKKYHRHTPQQIQELENFYQNFAHPDEKQRTALSNKLGLEKNQIKFWFQNRRTQMKSRMERHENTFLKGENERIKSQNDMLKQAMAKPICAQCGGPGVLGEVPLEQYQLKIENARLKDELQRICCLTNKFLGRNIMSPANPILSQGLKSELELAIGRNGNSLSSGFDYLMKYPSSEYDKLAFQNVALRALDELLKLAHMDSPLWTKGLDGGIEILNQEEYMKTFSSFVGVKASGYTTEASREIAVVNINVLDLVDTMMNSYRWAEMFPCIVSKASTVDLISIGTGLNKDGALQLMDADLHVLSPMAPMRLVRFIRFCKRYSEGSWAVVDVSIDATPDVPNAKWAPNCRMLPTGCLIQDINNNYSKVTWIEHSEYDATTVNHLLRPLISSGFGFGAPRWIATLKRQCECLAVITASPENPDEDNAGITLAGRIGMLKLAQRLTSTFCSGVCRSSLHKWDLLTVSGVRDDVWVFSRKIMNDPGEPSGILLSASTSEWFPVTQQTLFDYLRDERTRCHWDILSNGSPMHLVINIPKGSGLGNCVSVLGSSINGNENNMLILQESWCDASGALVVYAPVDLPSMSMVMKGGDSAYVGLLPSGFAILPGNGNSPSFHHGGQIGSSNGVNVSGCGGCILTASFQILVNSSVTGKLTTDSVQTLEDLVTWTMQKIKAALTM